MRGRTVVWVCLVACCSLWVSTACNSEPAGDYVFLENDDAVMPVWTRGAEESGTFVVHVHGGPGNSSIGLASDGVFESIEDDAAVVYWDQRGAGSAQGKAASESLTLEQYAEDLDKVVDLIHRRHRVDDLFLMSHGFGVNVAAEYLQSSEDQRPVDGWIFASGNFDVPKAIGLSHNWMVGFLEGQLKAGENTERWREIRGWYNENPTITTGELYRQHRRYVREANGYQKPYGFDRSLPDRSFDSPSNTLADVINRNRSQRIVWDRSSSLNLDVSPKLADITVPTLVIWGADDGLTPLPLSNRALEALGTADADKQRVVLKESAHRPELDQNRRFVEEVNQFIDSQ